MAVAIAGAQQVDDAPADPLGCVDRIFPRAARQGLRIEEEDRIDVRTVVQFTAAMLAKRDYGKSARFGVRHTLRKGRRNGFVKRSVRKVGQSTRNAVQIPCAGKIHYRRDKGNGVAPPPERLRSEEHTSELQSLMRISYAVFCLQKKK